MSNEVNQPWDAPDYDPWNQGTYRTGSTRPPKSHGGLIALLLVLVILLSGITTILGVVNIRLFRQVNTAEPRETLPISFSNDSPAQLSTIPPEEISISATESPAADIINLAPPVMGAENLPQEGGLSLQEIYDTVIDSVVSISCTNAAGGSTGTGVVLTYDGYIVTNCHVVENARYIQVLLTDGRTADATLVGMDEVSDLAVLQISADGLFPAQLGDSASLRVGDIVVAIGDPLGIKLRGTMTDGIISAISRDIDVDGRTMNLIQTNAALNSGNSGGPLINCYGQVIGINTMKIGDSMSVAGVEGLGFAIPSATVSDIVNQLINQGYVSGRPTLGITGESISNLYHFYYRLPKGLYITAVESGSSADIAGIEEGDILLSLEGVTITTNDSLKAQLYNYAPGDQITAIIYRSGKQYAVTLTVGEAKGS